MTNNATKQFIAPVLGPMLPLALAACIFLLGGCASPGSAIEPEAQARASAQQPAAPAAADFPAMESAKWKQGDFPSVEALRAMRTGMGKDQVRNLLGWPHFSEGLWGVREWNYIFHFRTGAGPEFVTCQYMVRFNEDALSTGQYWKSPECALLVNPAAARALPAAKVASPAEKVTLGADGLFRFDGSTPADLLPEGRRKVNALAADIQRNFKTLNDVMVTGHTDRLGTHAYNDALSLARARTVRDLLVGQGIDPKRVRTAGAGSRHPVTTQCVGTRATPELVGCLQPDRRVEIEVAGEK